MNKFMEFYSHVTENEEASKGLAVLSEKFNQDSDQESVLDELIAFAKKEGFHFEKEEVKGFIEGASASGELSDEELEAVAGGKNGSGGCFLLGLSLDSNGRIISICSIAGATESDGLNLACVIGGGTF